MTIETLPDEILRHVLIFLDPTEILLDIVHCSTRLAQISSSDNFWRFKCIDQYLNDNSLPLTPSGVPELTTKQLQQCCIISYRRKTCGNWLAPERNENDLYCWPGLILPTRAEAKRELRIDDDENENNDDNGRYCLCSSRDRGEEAIENVLAENDYNWEEIVRDHNTREDADDYSQRFVSDFDRCYWSSAPSNLSKPEDTNEVLLFTTKRRAIITEVAIKPLLEPFSLFMNTVFRWPRISIKIYSLPQKNDNEALKITKDMFSSVGEEMCQVAGNRFDRFRRTDLRLDQRAIIEAVLSNHNPVYESPIMDVTSRDNSWQYYAIPDGVVGNLITFTLYGKTFEQYLGSGFYVCVERVSARGVPLI